MRRRLINSTLSVVLVVIAVFGVSLFLVETRTIEASARDRLEAETARLLADVESRIASGEPIYSTGGGQNFGQFSNEEVDAAWQTLATSVDPEVHLEQVKIIEKLLWDDLYGIPLFAHPSMVGYDATLENVRDTAVQTGVSWNAEQWVRAQ